MNQLNRAMDMLKSCALNSSEGNRMCDLLASGPFCEEHPGDEYLIELGLAYRDEEEGCTYASDFAHKYFHQEDGGVRAPFRWWE